jgi:hypothetical protein
MRALLKRVMNIRVKLKRKISSEDEKLLASMELFNPWSYLIIKILGQNM